MSKTLVERVGRGDADALRELYGQSVDGLYAFVFFRVGKDKAAAEDIVQETFLAALGRLAEFDAGRGSFGAWLCQLSRNIARAHLVAQRRTEELDMWDRVDSAMTEAFARMERDALVDEILERNETRDLVHLAMSSLPDLYRRALEQKYVDERSLEEMATERGVSEDAVKSLLARARRAFRETFQSLGKALAGGESS
jgi:RNA polymerase sigma-70 factor (ECF subfamily)